MVKKTIAAKKYRELLLRKKEVLERIKKMESYKAIIEYKKLLEESNNLDSMQEDLFIKMKIEEYSNCDHVLVKGFIDYGNDLRDKVKHYYTCIKCGCNERVIDYGYLGLGEGIRYKYIKGLPQKRLKGKKLGIECNPERAMKIYNNICESNPNLSEEKIIEIFKQSVKQEQESNDNMVKDAITMRVRKPSIYVDPLS